MGCRVFLVVHHLNCYDIFFVPLPFSKPKVMGLMFIGIFFMAVIFEFVRSD